MLIKAQPLSGEALVELSVTPKASCVTMARPASCAVALPCISASCLWRKKEGGKASGGSRGVAETHRKKQSCGVRDLGEKEAELRRERLRGERRQRWGARGDQEQSLLWPQRALLLHVESPPPPHGRGRYRYWSRRGSTPRALSHPRLHDILGQTCPTPHSPPSPAGTR